ncbi:kinase-like protein, partial [Marasmius fiardii PR-910]
FYKEALLWTQLSHPNLLPFIGVNTTLLPGKLCLLAPWMVNGQVNKFLEINPSHDRLRVISEIIAGIVYLHSRNIVHGDIKGGNVLVDEQGKCYLADFGLAVASMSNTLLSSTTNSTTSGTMRWMAPELFYFIPVTKLNHNKLARDIYAYACTIYEIMTGGPPFSQLTEAQVMLKIISGERPERPS